MKWTTVEVGVALEFRTIVVAFCTAWTPVSDSISTEPRNQTLQAAAADKFKITLGFAKRK